MTGTTTGQTSFATATDSDDTEGFLTGALTTVLQAIANLFDSVTGHDHSGAGKGKPVGALAAGVVTGAAMGSLPAVRAYNSAAISLTSGTSTTLTFDTERYKTDAGMHSTASLTSRLVATITGKYRISGHVAFAASAGGTYRLTAIRHNGITFIAYQTIPPIGAASGPTISVSTTWHMAAGEYVELVAVQDSGAALNVLATPASTPEFCMEYVGQ